MKKGFILAGLITLFSAASALAHFQMIYTPQSALERGGELDMRLIFTHPFDGDHTMDMGPVEEFYVIHQRGEDGDATKTDLREYLSEISWKSHDNEGKAYAAKIPSRVMRSMGDYVFVLVPSPYLEGDDEYIKQYTKMIMNVGGVPGNWHEPVGLPVEIVPLDKPYANWTGGVFRGVVMANGEPVPHAELEIEYLNYEPDLRRNAFKKRPGIRKAPHPAFESMEIRANASGEFTIGLPKAGWWGIAAPDLIETEYKDIDMVKEAVLWIQVTDIK